MEKFVNSREIEQKMHRISLQATLQFQDLDEKKKQINIEDVFKF